MTNRKNKIKEFVKLFFSTWDRYEELEDLKTKAFNLNQILVDERLQPTEGFFKPKVTDFVEPKGWGKTEPCVVIIYRHGLQDWLDDRIVNIGNESDVKTFTCPHFDENVQCNMDCIHRCKNNEYLELKNKLIPAAQKTYDESLAKRKAAWQQIFCGKEK